MDSSDSSPVFMIRGLRKEYGLYRLSIDQLDIPAGVVALVGESGAGKSTLLGILGLLDPHFRADQLSFRKTSIQNGSIADLRRCRENRFSFAFQKSNLLSNLRVGMNVQLSRYLGGLSPAENCDDVLNLFFPELRSGAQNGSNREFARRYPSQLSVGQQQRVALTRAFVKAQDGAEVMFADEPTANLDRAAADMSFERLCDWQRQAPQERLLLLATHDLTLARKADHIILIGLNEACLSQPGNVREFHVVRSGQREDCLKEVEDRLVRGKNPAASDSSSPLSSPVVTPSPSNPPPTNHKTPTLNLGRRSVGPRLRLLSVYTIHDLFRRREALGTVMRWLVVMLLFFVLTVSAVLYRGIGRTADLVLRADRMLRQVEVESTGNFVINVDKMNKLASLSLEGPVTAASGHSKDAVVAGVSPRRQLPLELFKSDGKTNKSINGVWLVYPQDSALSSRSKTPGLLKGDPRLLFWNIQPVRPDSGAVVSPKLIESLGYDLESFRQQLTERAGADCLFAWEGGWKLRIPVERIEEFPDDSIDMLLPALLAEQIEQMDGRLAEKRYEEIGVGPFSSAEDAKNVLDVLRSTLEPALSESLKGNLTFKLDRSLDAPTAFAIWVRTRHEKGMSVEELKASLEPLKDRLPAPYHIEPRQPKGPGGRVENSPPPKATMATVFVNDYRDLPRIVEHIKNRREELKLRVLDVTDKNVEFVKTVLRGADMGSKAVIGMMLLFLLACLIGIGYSFAAVVRRKLHEIGILKAFGARKWIVLGRFICETAFVTVSTAAVAIALTTNAVVPMLNQEISRFISISRVIDQGGSPFVLDAVGWGCVVGGIIVALILMTFLIHVQTRKTPKELLDHGE